MISYHFLGIILSPKHIFQSSVISINLYLLWLQIPSFGLQVWNLMWSQCSVCCAFCDAYLSPRVWRVLIWGTMAFQAAWTSLVFFSELFLLTWHTFFVHCTLQVVCVCVCVWKSQDQQVLKHSRPWHSQSHRDQIKCKLKLLAPVSAWSFALCFCQLCHFAD